MKILLLAVSISSLVYMLHSETVQAGTAGYCGLCSFLDRKNNNDGSIYGMPCYVVEGGNGHGAFFHILWKDGVKTQLNLTIPSKDFYELVSGKKYKRVGQFTFAAGNDGDVISFDYRKSVYSTSVDDPKTSQICKL